ncbi:hypothetical protein [Solibacillus daqui]|uniref:hypothetical protein n=1 Tax=Solibacillus daqui TaxID=2912187 RepID=UPI002366FFBD|nr:hypothetical protein [Solibacillus daqui]
MDAESILKPIERFLESIEGAHFEARALQMKEEVEEVIRCYNLDLRAGAEYEDYLSQRED